MNARDVLTRPAEGPDLVLRYAGHADALVDVFLPARLSHPLRPSPLVVVLHGGFWRQEYDRCHLRPLAGALVRDGFVVAVPEFRRTGGTGGWPVTGADVEDSVHATGRLIDAAAPGHLDPAQPYVLAGHSAGGHLALWAGLRAGPRVVGRVVALAPVADLVEAARRGLDGGAVQLLLGGEPTDVPDAYAAADPLSLLPTRADGSSDGPSGVSGDGSGAVSVVIVQGTADGQVPPDINARVALMHPAVEYVELPGVDHFALIDPLSEAYRARVRPLFGEQPPGQQRLGPVG